MSLKLARDWDWKAFEKQYCEQQERMNVIIEIGELELAEPSFRKKARIIAMSEENRVRFALQYQHDGEPGVWLSDPSFPWHGANFDSIIRAAARYHERIEKVLKGEK